MSNVSNAVIHLGNTSGDIDWSAWITGHNFYGHGRDFGQSFQQLSLDNFDDTGGSKVFENDIFIAAFNYVYPEDIANWFESLPWDENDEAVLTVNGNDTGLICVRGENGLATRTVWFT